MHGILGNSEVLVPTRYGHRVPIFRPDPDSIYIEDIAAGLARRFRWSAQCDLTVAQHSVHVSYRLGGYEAKWGLLHDAAEAYLADVPRPMKERLLARVPLGPASASYERFEQVENRLLKTIGERFGLGWPIPPSVGDADDMELGREARDLFGDAVAAERAYPETLEICPPPLAETMFFRRFTELFREPAAS